MLFFNSSATDMSASKLARSGSDSWSMMPSTTQNGFTDTTTAAAGPTPCEAHGTPTHTDMTIRAAAAPATVTAPDASDEGEETDGASQVTDDSWVEVTATELESPSTLPLAAEAEAVCTDSHARLAAQQEEGQQQQQQQQEQALSSEEPSVTELNVATTVDAAHEEGAKEAQDSATVLRPVDRDEATLSSSTPPSAVEPSQAPPAAAAPPKMDLAEFLAGLTLTKAFEAATEPTPVTEHEAAARVLASFDVAEPADDFTSLTAEGREMEETVDIDFVPSSVSANCHNSREIHNSSSHGLITVSAPPTGCTEVLRRRVVEEDWMRTFRGPSELPPQERVEVFQALFGDTGNTPISAERFKEMMVPYERHCDCLGASYGFHHQGCRFYPGSELTS